MTAEGTAERAPGTRRWTGSGWTLGHYRCPVASDSPGADVTSARGSGRAQQRAWTQTPSQGDGRCDLHVISGQHGTRRVTAAATAISPVLPAERPPWVGLGTLPPVTPAAPVSTAHTSHGHTPPRDAGRGQDLPACTGCGVPRRVPRPPLPGHSRWFSEEACSPHRRIHTNTTSGMQAGPGQTRLRGAGHVTTARTQKQLGPLTPLWAPSYPQGV